MKKKFPLWAKIGVGLGVAVGAAIGIITAVTALPVALAAVLTAGALGGVIVGAAAGAVVLGLPAGLIYSKISSTRSGDSNHAVPQIMTGMAICAVLGAAVGAVGGYRFADRKIHDAFNMVSATTEKPVAAVAKNAYVLKLS